MRFTGILEAGMLMLNNCAVETGASKPTPTITHLNTPEETKQVKMLKAGVPTCADVHVRVRVSLCGSSQTILLRIIEIKTEIS